MHGELSGKVGRKLRFFLENLDFGKRQVTSTLVPWLCYYFFSTLLPRGLMKQEGKESQESLSRVYEEYSYKVNTLTTYVKEQTKAPKDILN